jgi:hypothetical protein
MTRIITYSLKAGAANSDEYYRAISSFADSWPRETEPKLLDLLDGFRLYRQSRGEADRSNTEYMFELLALGVLLREHGDEARHLPDWAKHLMQRLVDLQKRQPQLESLIKFLRGWLGWVADRVPGEDRNGGALSLMIAWLEANAETSKAERFGEWREYFEREGNLFTQTAISRCIELADAFAGTSREILGKYTQNVERFLREEAPRYCHRYDACLVSRTRLEYHLGMLGTELLNRAYRQRFRATKRKVVILPPCMCAPKVACEAVETPFGSKCKACTPTCRVHQITKLGEKRGFSVAMIPDDVKIYGSGKDAGSLGLVGVSCALTNWNGGWETPIPAQGLLLDYVGCKFHWDKDGIPTDTNLKRLQEILGM